MKYALRGLPFLVWVLLLVAGGCGRATPTPTHTPIPLPAARLQIAVVPAALPRLDRWIALFEAVHPEVEVEALPMSAAHAQRALADGEVDLALLEGLPAPSLQGVITATRVADEPIAAIVHPENRLRDLPGVPVTEIFAGKVGDWSQVGGDPGPVRVYLPPDNAGEVQGFRQAAMAGRQMAPQAIVRASPDSVARAVAGDQGAIGLLRASAARQDVVVLRIEGALPSEEGYPWSFSLFLTYGATPSRQAVGFLQFVRETQ
jgi:phosphate transport system substrate-binding protein